jgi:hypothetical protein
LQQQGGNYDWRNHLQLLKKRGTCSEEQQDRAETLYQQIAFSSYILPGATEALRILSHTFELWLITKGVPHMQHEKLSRANLQPFFGERIRIVTHDKIPAFEAIAAAGDTFINDHLEETRRITQSLPFLRALLFLRPDRDTLYDPSVVTEESLSEYHLLPALLT